MEPAGEGHPVTVVVPAPRSAPPPGAEQTGRMSRAFDRLDDQLTAFIERQKMFFVATAPSGDGGHVNLSPKGYDTFRVLDHETVAYLDLTGSGAETIAHLRDNGRITLLFCALSGKPNLVRLYGRGEVLEPVDEAFDGLAARFPTVAGTRAVIRVHLERVSTSCGYSVPFFEYVGERPTLEEWAGKRSDKALATYRAEKNAVSIDGLPALG